MICTTINYFIIPTFFVSTSTLPLCYWVRAMLSHRQLLKVGLTLSLCQDGDIIITMLYSLMGLKFTTENSLSLRECSTSSVILQSVLKSATAIVCTRVKLLSI